MRLLNRRSTIAPTAFAEHEDYMIKGDKFEKVLTFWSIQQNSSRAILLHSFSIRTIQWI